MLCESSDADGDGRGSKGLEADGRRRRLTGVSPFVDFEILTPGEDLSATGKRAREGFLSGVHPDVID